MGMCPSKGGVIVTSLLCNPAQSFTNHTRSVEGGLGNVD